MLPTAVVICFAALMAVAGIYYLAFSPATRNLAGVEAAATNVRRHQVRRVGAVALLLMAGLFLAGARLDPHVHPWLFLTAWGGVVIVLAVLVFLAGVDLRLTARLRRDFHS